MNMTTSRIRRRKHSIFHFRLLQKLNKQKDRIIGYLTAKQVNNDVKLLSSNDKKLVDFHEEIIFFRNAKYCYNFNYKYTVSRAINLK